MRVWARSQVMAEIGYGGPALLMFAWFAPVAPPEGWLNAQLSVGSRPTAELAGRTMFWLQFTVPAFAPNGPWNEVLSPFRIRALVSVGSAPATFLTSAASA